MWKNTSPGTIVSSGKSRTTGCTRAEYDRPVSLRSLASWIPARKSWASRIIGDLAVRPIAVSTSRSIEASVPSTISRVTGSSWLTRSRLTGAPGSRTLRVTTRLPKRSTRARNPGWSGTVAPYSSTTAGPSTTSPGARSSRR